jgi:hypothetical protein
MREFAFLDLPRELRDLVYEQVFFNEPNIDTSNVWRPHLAYEIQMWGRRIQCPTDVSDPRLRYSSIRQTCQIIRDEYDQTITHLGIIHAEADFNIDDILFAPRPFIFKLVQRIELEINFQDNDLFRYDFDWSWLEDLPLLKILAIALSSIHDFPDLKKHHYSLRGWIGELYAHVAKHVEVIWPDKDVGTEFNGLAGTRWIRAEELRPIVHQLRVLQGSMIEEVE